MKGKKESHILWSEIVTKESCQIMLVYQSVDYETFYSWQMLISDFQLSVSHLCMEIN